MKRIILLVAISLLLIQTVSYAQYWDWVTDEKSMNAFTEQYLDLVNGQLGKLYEYYMWTDRIRDEQEKIAEKVKFIHMVRDSLFKSLQHVQGIQGSIDETFIHNIYAQIQDYYSHIRTYANKHDDFKDTWTQYEQYVVRRSNDILKLTEMAVRGKDEKNLLDKEQRLFLLSSALQEARVLLDVSKFTYLNLQLGDKYMEFTNDKIHEIGKDIYKRANESIKHK